MPIQISAYVVYLASWLMHNLLYGLLTDQLPFTSMPESISMLSCLTHFSKEKRLTQITGLMFVLLSVVLIYCVLNLLDKFDEFQRKEVLDIIISPKFCEKIGKRKQDSGRKIQVNYSICDAFPHQMYLNLGKQGGIF